jgi:non-ribosomal peptide synthetase component F
VTERPTQNLPLGHAISETQLYVVEPDGLRQCALGEEGELCIGGVGLARGYLHREDLTIAKFIPNPFGPGRIYRTGDLVVVGSGARRRGSSDRN